MIKKLTRGIIFLVFIMSNVLFLYNSFAQKAVGIGISPATTNFIAGLPGQSQSGEIMVYNSGDLPIKVEIRVADFIYSYSPNGERKPLYKAKGSIPDSCAEWMSVIPSGFELRADESRTISYIINLPKEARGGKYGALLFSATLSKRLLKSDAKYSKDVSQISLVPVSAIAVRFFVEPTGTINRRTSVEIANIYKLGEDSPLELEFQFTNLGNTYAVFDGVYYILTADGKIQGSGKIPKRDIRQGEVFNESLKWLGNLPKGNYDIVVTLKISDGRESEQIIVKEAKISVDEGGKIKWVK